VDTSIAAPGQTVRLTIDDIAFGGEGVGRLNDFVVFVPFVALGETVEAELIEVKKRFARARLLKILQPSPDRVAPPCRYFGECGGCQYQHLAYPVQLRIKHKQACDLLQRIGGIDPARVDPVIPCPEPYGYRNRIMIRSQWDKYKQGLNIGGTGPQRANPPRSPATAPQRGDQSGVTGRCGRLGGAAGLVFPDQLSPFAQVGGNRRSLPARQRLALLD
jgi:tRNA/tmRNA/rRNA uracil-C5-methylase (TrmA/RlmC/RlmD family)